MSSIVADRNMLFGMLALKMDFISRAQLIAAVKSWDQDKEKPLAQVLREHNAVGGDTQTLLESLVQLHLAEHGNDAVRSLAVEGIADALRRDLGMISESASKNVPATETAPTQLATTGETRSAGKRFRILRPHRQGGLGKVYLARDEEFGREVALKEIREQADTPTNRDRFLREARIAGALEHPGIVPVYGFGTHADGRPYYAMRFIHGESLKDAVTTFHDDKRPARETGGQFLELRLLLGRLITVCHAIQYAHDQGIVHRDLKPANIMLGEYGETLVVDWGLAKAVTTAGPKQLESPAETSVATPSVRSEIPQDQTAPGTISGTPPYMSPEQVDGRPVGPASDVYSLGATLYTVLTGKVPFMDDVEADSIPMMELLDRVRKGRLVPPHRFKPALDPALAAICLKSMALKPEDRYPTPRALADDIEHWLADEPTLAYRETWFGRAARFARRHRSWVRTGVLALFLVTLAAVVSTVLIAHAREREALAYRQNNLRRDFFGGIKPFTLEQASRMEQLLAEWEDLDPEEAGAARAELMRAAAASVEQALATPTLTEANLQNIDRHLAYLEARDKSLFDPLRARRDQRLRQWQRVFLLAEPFHELPKVLDLARVRLKNDRLVLQPEARAAGLPHPLYQPTQVRCAGNVRLRAVFADWQSAPVVGLLLNHGPRHRYEFLVSVPQLGRRIAIPSQAYLQGLPTLNELGARGEPMRVQILRNGVALRQSTAQVPRGRLELRAERLGDKLIFQVNQLPPVQFNDPFPLGSEDPGVFGVCWPEGARLVRLEAERQALPPRPSPMEKADSLFAEGRFADCLALYQEQIRTSGKTESQQEARFKLAQCLQTMNRADEALRIWRELFDELPAGAEPDGFRAPGASTGSAWQMRAACQLWLAHLKQDRRDLADQVMEKLVPTYKVETLATLVPDEVREDILDKHFRFRDPMWRSVFFYKDHIKKLELADQVESLLEESYQERRLTRWRLLIAYRANRELKKAIGIAEDLVDDTRWPDVSVAERIAMVRQFVWTLLEDEQPTRALSEIDKLLTGASASAYQPLLLERARVQAVLGNFAEAEKDIERVFRDVPRAGLEYAEHADACLLRGFLRLERHDRDGAEAAWRLGLAANWPGGLPPTPKTRLLNIRAIVNHTNSVNFSIQLGSLLRALTAAESATILNHLVSSAGANCLLVPTLTRLSFSAEFIRDVMHESYGTPRGLHIAKRMCYRTIDYRGFYLEPIHLALAAISRVGAFPKDVSPELDSDIWEGARDLVATYAQGKLKQGSLVNLLLLWRGNMDPRRCWQDFTAALEPSMRLRLCLLLGCRLQTAGQAHNARPFFEELLQRAPRGSLYYRIARAHLK